MKDKSDNANYTKKETLCESASGKADRRMSQVSQLSLFTNVLAMSLRVLCSHPVLCSNIDKTLIYAKTDYHKLHTLVVLQVDGKMELSGNGQELLRGYHLSLHVLML